MRKKCGHTTGHTEKIKCKQTDEYTDGQLVDAWTSGQIDEQMDEGK